MDKMLENILEIIRISQRNFGVNSDLILLLSLLYIRALK